jgi:4-amino-4-deoxy-L-arabinose transferase-like glycosyltransferase
MFRRVDHRAGHYALLLAVGAALFLTNLGGPTLWDVDEGRNATAAFEMLESGNWVVPTFNSSLRSHKPVLLYWLQAAAYSAFGVNEFAARLPSALAALLSLLLVYELGRAMFGAATGLLAGVILGSAAMFCAAARFANPDALLGVATLLTLWLCWLAWARGNPCWFVPAGAAAGLAVLAKGPSGLALPGAAMVLFLAWSRRLRWTLSRGWIFGVVACLLVALPWYIWVGVETKWEFLRDFLLTHNLDRALAPMENHRGPPYYYLLVLLVGLAPWSVFLGLALWHGVRAAFAPGDSEPQAPARGPDVSLKRQRGALNPPSEEEPRDAYRFLACWVVVYLVAFTVARTKLPNYILPTYPAVALLTARYLDRWRRGAVHTPAWLTHASFACLALVGVLTAAGLLVAGGVVHLPQLRGRVIAGLEVWALIGMAPLLGAAAAWWLHRRGRRGGLVAALAVSAVAYLFPVAAWGAAALDGHKPARPLVETAGAFRRDRDIRVATYCFEHLPSLNFYCQRNVLPLQSEDEVLELLHYPLPVLVFTTEALWGQLEARAPAGCRVVARHRDLYRNTTAVVIANRCSGGPPLPDRGCAR